MNGKCFVVVLGLCFVSIMITHFVYRGTYDVRELQRLVTFNLVTQSPIEDEGKAKSLIST